MKEVSYWFASDNLANEADTDNNRVEDSNHFEIKYSLNFGLLYETIKLNTKVGFHSNIADD